MIVPVETRRPEPSVGGGFDGDLLSVGFDGDLLSVGRELAHVTEGTGDNGPFDESIVRRVAAERGVDAATLSDLVRRHQAGVADLPGIENLAYEWRKQFDAPVLDRTADAYYLSVPAWVWDEFGDHLSIDDAELDALVAVHCEHVVARTAVEEATSDHHGDDRTLVVLDRTVEEP